MSFQPWGIIQGLLHYPSSWQSCSYVFFFQANVGKGFDIGYLKYIDNVWDYPPMRWGIIGGAAALFVIITIIVVCCCCKKSSNNRGRQNGQYGHHHQDPRFFPQQPPHYPQHPQHYPQHAQQGRPHRPQKRGQQRY